MKISHWVKTGESVGLPFTSMPAYAAFPILPCLFYARTTTLVFALLCTVAIAIMSKKGYTLIWLVNRTKGRLHGGRISARNTWVIRRYAHACDPARDLK